MHLRANSARIEGSPLGAALMTHAYDDMKSAVVISADRNVKYESVVNVIDALQRAGVQRVGLSVQLAK